MSKKIFSNKEEECVGVCRGWALAFGLEYDLGPLYFMHMIIWYYPSYSTSKYKEDIESPGAKIFFVLKAFILVCSTLY